MKYPEKLIKVTQSITFQSHMGGKEQIFGHIHGHESDWDCQGCEQYWDEYKKGRKNFNKTTIKDDFKLEEDKK